MRGLGDIVQVLFLLLPPWAIGVLAVVLAILVVPRLAYRIRSRQVREAVRRMIRATPEARVQHEARAFERAGDDVALLAELAREARKRSLPGVQAKAVARLEGTPAGRKEAKAFAAETAKPTVGPMHVLERRIRIERLLDAELWEAARLQLDEGLRATPDDAGLRALADRLARDADPVVDPPKAGVDVDDRER